jgi:hypothetical protein
MVKSKTPTNFLVFILLVILIIGGSIIIGMLLAKQIFINKFTDGIGSIGQKVLEELNGVCDDAKFISSYPPLPNLNVPADSKSLMYYIYLLCENVTNSNCISPDIPLPKEIDPNSVRIIKNPHLDSIYGYIMYAPKEKTTFIIWSGTANTEMWIHDSQIITVTPKFAINKNVKVHKGFLDIYQGVRDDLETMLYNDYAHKTKRLIIAGHSLGGALAQLSSWDLFCNKIHKDNFETISVYTFGSPRCGNKHFVEDCEGNIDIYRIENSEDVVPSIPFSASPWQYTHIGETITFTNNMGTIAKNHIDSYKEYLKTN